MTISSHSCTRQADNTMRYDCTVALSGGVGTVKVGFRKDGTAAYKWSKPQTGTTLSFTLYNFEPDATYNYQVNLISEGVSQIASLPDYPTLPTTLGLLDFTLHRDAAAKTKYVLFDTWDCSRTVQYLVAYDTINGWIAWYQDIQAETGYPNEGMLPEWSYTSDQTILAVINHAQVYEWAWDGSEVGTTGPYAYCETGSGGYGPCPHHDAARSADSGDTFIVTGVGDTTYLPADTVDFAGCTDPGVLGFVDDGVEAWDGAWSPVSGGTWSLRSDFLYDPTPTGAAGPSFPPPCTGPYWEKNWGTDGFIDWTHVNSIYVEKPGLVESVTLSSRELAEVFNYVPDTGVVRWTLNGLDAGRSTLALSIDPSVTGLANFGGQHNVMLESGRLQMFDNRSDVPTDTSARGLRLEITPGPSGTAVITQSFVMRELTSNVALNCSEGLGSAVGVPLYDETNMLLNCGPLTVIEELDESDGVIGGDPLLYLALDHSGAHEYCENAPLMNPDEDLKFYRAWPIGKLGDF